MEHFALLSENSLFCEILLDSAGSDSLKMM